MYVDVHKYLSPEGYILADAGYDVWLGNYRGNGYGKSHCSLDPENIEFWDFRYHCVINFSYTHTMHFGDVFTFNE